MSYFFLPWPFSYHPLAPGLSFFVCAEVMPRPKYGVSFRCSHLNVGLRISKQMYVKFKFLFPCMVYAVVISNLDGFGRLRKGISRSLITRPTSAADCNGARRTSLRRHQHTYSQPPPTQMQRYFVQEDLLSHEYSPPRLSVSRTNSLV